MEQENHELEVVSIRLVKDAPIMSETPISNADEAVKLLGEYMCQLDREVLCVLNMKANGIPINCSFVSMGSLQESILSPREIFKSSILSNAASMLLIHNHPSGRLTPSVADTRATDRMIQLCNMMGIPLLDHIIVGGFEGGYYSFRENHMLSYQSMTYTRNVGDLNFSGNMLNEPGQTRKTEVQKLTPKPVVKKGPRF